MSGKLCQILAVLNLLRNSCAVQPRVGCAKLSAYALMLLFFGGMLGVVHAQEEGAGAEVAEAVQEASTSPLSDEIESLKKKALELNRDLLILEEELLFPANTQVMVFLSLDVGAYFRLDAVKLHIDDKLVASHLYTPRQNDALSRGGIQRLYIGNIKTGEHELTAFFTGIGPDNREYKRAATVSLEKDDDPKMLELRIKDSTANMQPEFDFKEWQL